MYVINAEADDECFTETFHSIAHDTLNYVIESDTADTRQQTRHIKIPSNIAEDKGGGGVTTFLAIKRESFCTFVVWI